MGPGPGLYLSVQVAGAHHLATAVQTAATCSCSNIDSGVVLDPLHIAIAWCPPQESFLEALAALSPDLAITAAYGNMLPTAFLDLPRFGTLNIHPSLLPKYRGAAPVQRAVEV